MGGFKFGCQTYTWQMSFERYVGKIPHILDVLKQAGYAGVEPETCMLGSYYDDPGMLAEELGSHDLALAALTLALPWAHERETDEERAEAAKAVRYLKHFPGTPLVLCQLPGPDRSDLQHRQKNAIACINAVAARAAGEGIACAFHPNSPEGSVFRVRDDYEKLMDHIKPEFLGFAPDAGHIAKGGMDVLEVFKAYRQHIRHVHFKDIGSNGKWATMGDGVIDFPTVVKFLRETDYNGWIIVEEESRRAESHPDEVTIANGKYVEEKLI